MVGGGGTEDILYYIYNCYNIIIVYIYIYNINIGRREKGERTRKTKVRVDPLEIYIILYI